MLVSSFEVKKEAGTGVDDFSCVKGAGYLVSISGGQAGAYAPCHITPIPLHGSL